MTGPTTPSRTFLVQQATLTAFHGRYPGSIAVYGRTHWARKLFGLIRDDFEEGQQFCARVRAEFDALRARHGRAAA